VLLTRPPPLALKGTVFGKWYGNQDDDSISATTFYFLKGDAPVSKEILRLPSSRESAFMYKYAAGYLRWKGYEHYEVSSYALKVSEQCGDRPTSYRSQHNQIYWALDSQWYAIGLGATSFVNGRILARPRTLVDYQRWVVEQVVASVDDHEQAESISDLDSLMDTVLKRLRTSEGLSLNWVQQRFGVAYKNAVLRGSQLGLDLALAHVDRRTNVLRLVDPDGFLYSNSIISSIFVELEGVP
jgi:coproporphyrinogen III oxidase-like Fe-S oxidoreductase